VSTDRPIAIVGMSCLFPRAGGLKGYWHVLRAGVDCIGEVPSTHWNAEAWFDDDPKSPDRTYCRRGGFLDPVSFDPTEFQMPPNALEATDTSQILGLVVAKAALEDAGYGEGRTFDRERTSVILGVTGCLELVIPLGARLGHPIWRQALTESGVDAEVAEEVVRRISSAYVPWQENSFPGLLGNVVAGRIANRLDLHGTNCVVDAACASSNSAAHLATLELAAGRADMVVTGGVDTFNDIFMYMCFSKTPALSPTGDVRPFSAASDGTLLGEGIGMVVLKRLEDAERDGDRIYAVIKGVGTSSDGEGQAIYAPSSEGQRRCLTRAYENAGVDPTTVGMVEAHGTGTRVGDVVEFEALRSVYSGHRRTALGTVKSQIGHTKAAAGAAGLIKVALALYHKVLPPTLKADPPNPRLQIGESPFYLSSVARPWIGDSAHPRRGALSAFGFGGSNFHIVMEEHRPQREAPAWDGSVDILALSASSREALAEALAAAGKGDRAEVAHRSRQTFSSSDPWRLVVVLDGEDALATAAAVLSGERRSAPGVHLGHGPMDGSTVFLFPGQGSQYLEMGRELACVFPEMLDALEAAGAEVAARIHPPPALDDAERDEQMAVLTRTENTQPALGAVERGMLAILERFGLRCDFACGHSYGELAALHAAGRLSEEELHRLSRARGRAMADLSGDLGTMLAVTAPLEQVEAAVRSLDVVLANRNAPRQAILSGSREAIEAAAAVCREQGWKVQGLKVGAAFHSPLVAAARDPFAAALADVELRPGRFPVYANLTAAPYPDDAAGARALLADQLVSPVDFVGQIENLYAAGARFFVEVGPRATLSGLVRSILGDRPHACCAVDASAGRGGLVDLARALASCAAAGLEVDLRGWETAPAPKRKKRMEVMLVGANYRSPRSSGSESVPRPAPQNGRSGLPEPSPNGHRGPAASATPPSAVEVGVRSEAGTGSVAGFAAATAPRPGAGVGAGDAPPPVAGPGAVGAAHPAAGPGAVAAAHPAAGPGAAGASHPAAGHGAVGASHPAAGPGAVAAYPPGPPASQPEVAPRPGPAAPPPPAGLLAEAFRSVQGNIQALQALQQQTAEAHQRFLEGQELAQRTFQQVLEGQQRLVERMMGGSGTSYAAPPSSFATPAGSGPASFAPASYGAPAAAAPSPSYAPPTSQATPSSFATPAAAPSPSYASPTAPAPPASYAAPAPPMHAAPGAPAPVSAAPPPNGTAHRAQPAPPDLAPVLLTLVADKTGYPVEMLHLDMDLESDLGIDSIKRVEILAGMEERAPGAPRIETDRMGTLRTLRQVVELLSGPSAAPTESSTPAAAPTHSAAADVLLEVIADKTGYPREMLGLDMDLESDLGIDSIKRVEILAAMEERFPASSRVETDRMGSLRTVRQVLEALAPPADPAPPSAEGQEEGARRATGAADREATAGLPAVVHPNGDAGHRAPSDASTLGTTDDTVRLQRQVLRAVAALRPPKGRIALAEGHEIRVTDDGSGLSAGLVEALAHDGLAARLVSVESAHVGDLPCGGLVVVAPRPGEGVPEPVREEAIRFLHRAFAAVSRLAPDLRRSAGLLATVTRMDGAFGLAEGADDPVLGGLAGLPRTAAHEWPEVRCRALDVAPDAPLEAVVAELTQVSPLEAGVTAVGRTLLETVPVPVGAPADAPPFTPGDLVVISGGARGVTAEAALALAAAWRPTLLLLGRSAEPAADPTWLSGLEGEADLKKAILTHHFNGGPRPTPADLERVYREYAANREVRATLRRLQALGVHAVYKSVDVRDAEAVRAVVADARQRFGPVRGLVHAAGVLADKRIEEKSEAQFAAVVDTKLVGLRNLLAAAGDDLRMVALFSSVTARFGRPGQVDYCMANEALNKIAGTLARQGRARVVSVNWGPWDGGMVNDGLRREFARLGVGLIPLVAGARALVDEITGAGQGHEVEVLIGDGFPEPAHPGLSLRVSLERYPFLDSHRLAGRPVVPVALLVEWMAHAALHAQPGMRFVGIDDLAILKGLVLEGPVDVNLVTRPAAEGVEVEVRTAATLHARGRVLLAHEAPTAPSVSPPRFDGRAIDTAACYERLFHGPHFQALRAIPVAAAEGLLAELSCAPRPSKWIDEPLRSDWVADPLVLDGGLQMGLVWAFQNLDSASLPTRAARYRQYARFPRKGVTAWLEVQARTSRGCRGDLTFVDPSGRLVARFEGVEWAADPSLDAAFAQGRPEKTPA
jgi:acyl transferase domain-containing protein